MRSSAVWVFVNSAISAYSDRTRVGREDELSSSSSWLLLLPSDQKILTLRWGYGVSNGVKRASVGDYEAESRRWNDF